MRGPKLESQLTAEERELLASLTTPRKIQDFLDTITYEAEYFNRSPLRVIRERTGHCYDGALFAAATLRRLGYPPLVVDLTPEPLMDDDHMLAIFRRNGAYGAVAKSNFTGLRYREPVYRNLRELVMSYFDDYFNALGQRTLRGYTMPLNLRRFDAIRWEIEDAGCDAIEQTLEELRKVELLTPAMIQGLTPVDPRALEAGMAGGIVEGFFVPGIA
jgi:hypothetical protein